MNLAYIMLQPKYDFAMVMMTNVGGDKADQALKALGQSFTRVSAPPPPARAIVTPARPDVRVRRLAG